MIGPASLCSRTPRMQKVGHPRRTGTSEGHMTGMTRPVPDTTEMDFGWRPAVNAE